MQWSFGQQNQLNDKQYELEKTQQELRQIEDKKNWLLNRRYNNSKPGDVIYLYKDYKNGNKQCDEFIYKKPSYSRSWAFLSIVIADWG